MSRDFDQRQRERWKGQRIVCSLSLRERGRGLSENLVESLRFDYMRIANLQLSSFYQSIQEEWNFCWNYA